MSEAQEIVLRALPESYADLTISRMWEAVRALVPGGTESIGANLQKIAAQLEQMRPLGQQQTAALTENTQAVVANTAERSGAAGVGSAIAERAKGTATTILKGLTLSPLISGLVGWIKGSKAEEPVTLTKYVHPAPVRLEAGLSGGGTDAISAVDYDDNGWPRVVTGPRQYAGPPITVQVQAFDSRSFLDHSEEIARAVREALLNAHALGDVIREL